MAALKRFWHTLTTVEGAHGFITSDLVKPWLFPAAGAAVTLLSGFVSSVPVPYLLTGASIVFAAIATALLRLDEWRERTDPSGKLAFEAPIFYSDIELKNDLIFLKGVQFGIILKSSANYFLQYEIVSIDSQFMGVTAHPPS